MCESPISIDILTLCVVKCNLLHRGSFVSGDGKSHPVSAEGSQNQAIGDMDLRNTVPVRNRGHGRGEYW